MPYGGNDWLALTQEAPLEPDMPICDPHHHFWDLRLRSIPYQRYLLHELNGDIYSGHNITSTVFVEARAMYRAEGSEESRSVGEVEFVQGLAAASASGIYGPGSAAAAIVGHANLNLGSRVEPVLQALQAASPNRFRGIRHSVTWDPHPEVENTAAHQGKNQLGADEFRVGAKVLSDMGFSFEAWMNHPQLPELADFAKALPDLTIILNHIGGLMRTGPYAGHDDEVLPVWREGIAAVAECPNINIKLGGIGMPRTGFNWHTREVPIGSEELASDTAPLINYCIEKFGPNRCMFESNFPPDKVSFSYNVMYNSFKRISQVYSTSDRTDLFHDTAVRVYRINE